MAAFQAFQAGNTAAAMQFGTKAIQSFMAKSPAAGAADATPGAPPPSTGPGSTAAGGTAAAQIKIKTTLADVIQFSGCRDDQTSADANIGGQATGARGSGGHTSEGTRGGLLTLIKPPPHPPPLPPCPPFCPQAPCPGPCSTRIRDR